MATADLTVIGLGRPDPSAGAYVAAIQRKLAEQEKVAYRMHAMGTSLEGSIEVASVERRLAEGPGS